MSTAARRRELSQKIRSLDPEALPVRRIRRARFYRQTAPSREATDLPQVAESEGRYHRERGQPPMYASSTEDAAWGELFRHHLDYEGNAERSPFEVRRRVTPIEIHDLPVLDLTDRAVRRRLGVRLDDLVSNDRTVCHAIAERVRRRPDRFGGILGPSAAIRSEQTLAVCQERLRDHVVTGEPAVTTPPEHLFGLFELIIDTLPAVLRQPARQLASQIQREWTRRT